MKQTLDRKCVINVVLAERSISDVLRRLGFRHLVARLRHPATTRRRKLFPRDFAALIDAVLPGHARGKPLELWWQDEARIGQQGTLTQVWAEPGSRPGAPCDQRYSWSYLFGAICPACSTGAALVLPAANAAMNLNLLEISTAINSGTQAVLVLDGAG